MCHRSLDVNKLNRIFLVIKCGRAKISTYPNKRTNKTNWRMLPETQETKQNQTSTCDREYGKVLEFMPNIKGTVP